jgi:hypothetical protein
LGGGGDSYLRLAERRFLVSNFCRAEESIVISIWFFIGVSLAVNGLLILGAGIYQFVYPPAKPEVILFHLQAGIWWGALLLVLGLVYCFKFAPGRTSL